jgi:hypothetical protein
MAKAVEERTKVEQRRLKEQVGRTGRVSELVRSADGLTRAAGQLDLDRQEAVRRAWEEQLRGPVQGRESRAAEEVRAGL